MEQNTPYRYEAKNDGSYNELAAYAINLVGNVALYPSLHTIIIDGKFADDVGKFIDKEGLDVFVAPIEIDKENIADIIHTEAIDAGTLRKVAYMLLGRIDELTKSKDYVIAELIKERDNAKKDGDLYMRWKTECDRKSDRIKGQVKAIALLLNDIFPDDDPLIKSNQSRRSRVSYAEGQ